MTELQFITNADGAKTAVILPIEEFEEMIEDLHFGQVARESDDEPVRDFTSLLEEMRTAGEIDV